jgi:hypothetical protein
MVGSGAKPDGISVGDQAIWNRWNDCAGDRGGARADKPRDVRILAITVGPTMAAMIFKVPPHWGQCSMSISNTRLSNRAQLMRAGADGGGASPCSAEVSWVLTGALGMISERSRALGTSTPCQ